MAYFFSFMLKQGKLAEKFVRIDEEDPGKARIKMLNAFGTEWAFQYPEEDLYELQSVGMSEISMEEALRIKSEQE